MASIHPKMANNELTDLSAELKDEHSSQHRAAADGGSFDPPPPKTANDGGAPATTAGGGGEPATADGGGGEPPPNLFARKSSKAKFKQARLKLAAMKQIDVVQTEAQSRPRFMYIKGACVPLDDDYGAVDAAATATAAGAPRKKLLKQASTKAWGALRSGVVTVGAADEGGDNEPSRGEPSDDDTRTVTLLLLSGVKTHLPTPGCIHAISNRRHL